VPNSKAASHGENRRLCLGARQCLFSGAASSGLSNWRVKSERTSPIKKSYARARRKQAIATVCYDAVTPLMQCFCQNVCSCRAGFGEGDRTATAPRMYWRCRRSPQKTIDALKAVDVR
jgi:hypothetical protein